MNNLYAISFAEIRPGPFGAAHHMLIEFNCNSLGRQREMDYQIVQRELIGNLPTFAIDLNVQCSYPDSVCLARQENAPQLGRFAIKFGSHQNGSTPFLERRQVKCEARHAVVIGLRKHRRRPKAAA